MTVLYLKALHITFVVTWFSALFYLGRLLIYWREAQDKIDKEREVLSKQFELMTKRLLFAIGWPSAVLSLIFGISLIYKLYGYNIPMWLWIKLSVVLFLLIYHYFIHRIYTIQKQSNFPFTSKKLRIFNELATFFLIIIVFLVSVKEPVAPIYGLIGLITLMVIILSLMKLYRKRKRQT